MIKPCLAASLMKSGVEHTDENILQAMEKLRYPVIATLKKDGIRSIRLDDLRSRTLKLIPNISIRMRSMKLPYGFDSELWNPELPYDEVESIVMSAEHPDSDKIQFHALDLYHPTDGYLKRMRSINDFDVLLNLNICETPETLFKYFLKCESEQGEGICFRTPDSPYFQKDSKDNRSTLTEQWLVKLSRFIRSEATIVGFVEAYHNANRVQRNALGKMKRSQAASGMIPKGTLASFICTNAAGLTFRVSRGALTDKQCLEIWEQQEPYIGKTLTYKSKPFGVKIAPRSPQFVGWRTDGY